MRVITDRLCAIAFVAARRWVRIGFHIAGLALFLTVVAGCAHPTRLEAVPEQGTARASVTDIPNARFYLDSVGIAAMNREALAALDRERAAYVRRAGPLPPAYFLALSGGGEDGAFGAGLLAGWTEHGTRPEFKLVTGVSAGALIAPFAYLGREYDHVLREIFTETGKSEIFQKRSILSILGGDAVVDTAPLFQTILKYVDDDVVGRIAQSYQKGRLLLIGTTNLDAGRPVVWNIGAIAASGHPSAREMIARILLASSAVPAVFPPVLFDAELDGQKYQEMHVDGGTIANTFLYPPALNARITNRRRVAYVIRNGTLTVPWQSVKRETLAIAGRAVSTLSASNTVNDIYQIYDTTKRDRVEFNLAYIGPDFPLKSSGQFDPKYIDALLEYGVQKGRQGYAWKKVPPTLLWDAPGIPTSEPASTPRSNRPEVASAR
jgi:predicted acylesterase/phospholipase RssA